MTTNKQWVLGMCLVSITGFLITSSFFYSISHNPSEVQAQTPSPTPTTSDWYMAGANPARTSWVNADISALAGTNAGVVWYRPIEAFIDSKTQIITANGNIYVATTKGLIVLDATTGAQKWRFDTEMPLGHSPTVIGDMVYIGGYDRKFYGIRDLSVNQGQNNYRVEWTFIGAKAGYSTSPLVVNNVVYIGNRDGYFYAINATSGNLVWQYPAANQEPLGPIMDSAAYSSTRNTLYFASNNMRGYALNASSGQPVDWFHTENTQQVPGTEKLSGNSIQSFWPVVLSDRVIFSSSNPFLDGTPGYDSLPGTNNVKMENYRDVVFGSLAVPTPAPSATPYPIPPIRRYSGNTTTADQSSGWPTGTALIDISANTNNPQPTPPAYYASDPISLQQYFDNRPTWRTTTAVSVTNGQILTGLDNPPFIWSGTSTGSRVPPVVNPQTGAVYNANAHSKIGIPRQKVMGWLPGNRYLANPFSSDFAIDEPAILSGAGTEILMNLCCDRIAVNLSRNKYFWTYGNMLDEVLPSQNSGGQYTPNIANRYDPMWGLASSNLERLEGYYKGTYNTPNGIYTNHGLQNPLVPYRFTNAQGQTVQRIFTHKSNTIIAIGETSTKQYLSPILVDSTVDAQASPITESELTSRLEKHLDTMLLSRENDPQHRFLNPGYYVGASRVRGPYYAAPAETLLILSEAYQLLQQQNINISLRNRLQTYIQDYYTQYLSTSNIGNVGWQGLPREESVFTPEMVASIATRGPIPAGFEMRDVYGLWKYAETFPSNPQTTLALQIYNRVKNSVLTTIPPAGTSYSSVVAWHHATPWELNNYIAGYYGLLHLQDIAGYTTTFCTQNPSNTECQKRSQVQTSLNTLLSVRSQNFDKDQPIFGLWDNPDGITLTNGTKVLNISRNFLYLIPELADHFASTIPSQIQTAMTEYTYLGPFWFASKVDNAKQERTMQHLFDSPYLFAAKAWILHEPQEQLSKYIDVPSFPRGDLFYIQNLVTAIEAPSDPSYTPPPTQPVTPTIPTSPTPTQGVPTGTPLPTPTPIPGDLDNSGQVGVSDLNGLLSAFGSTNNPLDPSYSRYNLLADLDGSGAIGVIDLNGLLSNFGRQ